MEREMGTALDGQEVLERVAAAKSMPCGVFGVGSPVTRDEAHIRFYYTPKRAYFDDKFFVDEANNAWQTCGSDWMKAWSAVGFFFARKIAAELECTVGIIGCNWGGTSAACWMSRDALLERESTRIYVDEYDNSPDRVGKSEQEQIDDYEKYVVDQAEWDRKAGEVYAEVPRITWDEVQERIGKCFYPGPMNCASFQRPYGLYETMLQRVAPYTVQGFIFYQGENDGHRPEAYYDMMQAMIPCWRHEFNDEKAAFFLTQLPMHRYNNDDPSWKNWPVIREAQMKAADTILNVGTAVAIDQGEFNEIHPQYKLRVGERLALQALWKVYDLLDEDEACGPMATNAEQADDGAVIVRFAHCEGLQVLDRLYGTRKYNAGEASNGDNADRETSATDTVADIPGFELAGDDGEFHDAVAVIYGEDNDCLLVKSDKVSRAVSIRYQWMNYGEVNLYGEVKSSIGEPLPVAPFRLNVD